MSSDKPNPIAIEPESLRAADVEQSVIRLISHASRVRASDLYLCLNEKDGQLAVRHEGIIKQLCRVSREECMRYVNHLKAVAGMPLGQKIRPGDGRWICPIDGGGKVDLRISTIPTLWGEDLTMRLLQCDLGLLDLSKLGYPRRALEDLYLLLNSSSGLLLVSGPSGAGKTTTLYACLNYLNNGARKINTIEDPIEYEMPGVRQSQVRPEVELDFPTLLRSVLRQAADIIMVGEIRDPVTAETAVLAANSGHLVLATLHAPFAASCVNTMLALGVNARFLSTCLLGAVSQRLVRTLCDHCKVAHDLSGSPQTFEEIREWLEPGQGDWIYSAPGCEKCFHEGYAGRSAVAEVLSVDKQIRQMIHEKRTARDIRDKAIAHGMLDLRRSALLKVAQGVTSTEELMRTIPPEHLLPDD